MRKTAIVGSSAFITLLAFTFSASAAFSDPEGSLWPDDTTGASVHGERARDHKRHGDTSGKALISHPFTSRHGSSPRCSIKPVRTTDDAGNVVTIHRHLCN